MEKARAKQRQAQEDKRKKTSAPMRAWLILKAMNGLIWTVPVYRSGINISTQFNLIYISISRLQLQCPLVTSSHHVVWIPMSWKRQAFVGWCLQTKDGSTRSWTIQYLRSIHKWIQLATVKSSKTFKDHLMAGNVRSNIEQMMLPMKHVDH